MGSWVHWRPEPNHRLSWWGCQGALGRGSESAAVVLLMIHGSRALRSAPGIGIGRRSSWSTATGTYRAATAIARSPSGRMREANWRDIGPVAAGERNV